MVLHGFSVKLLTSASKCAVTCRYEPLYSVNLHLVSVARTQGFQCRPSGAGLPTGSPPEATSERSTSDSRVVAHSSSPCARRKIHHHEFVEACANTSDFVLIRSGVSILRGLLSLMSVLGEQRVETPKVAVRIAIERRP